MACCACWALGMLRRLCEAMALTVGSVFLMRWWSLFQDQLLQLVGRLALFGVDAGLGQQSALISAWARSSRRLTFSAAR
jgi:hypothetical protein